MKPEFVLMGEDKRLRPLKGEMVAETWNPKSRVWSGVYSFELLGGFPGENTLYLDVPLAGAGDAVVNRELKLDLIH